MHRDRTFIQRTRLRRPSEVRLMVAHTVTGASRHLHRSGDLSAALVGARLCDGDGLALALEIRARYPSAHVAMTTRAISRRLVNRLYALGIGYAIAPCVVCLDALFAHARTSTRLDASAAVAADELERRGSSHLLMPAHELEKAVQQVAASPTLLGVTLSRRQLEVLALAVQGHGEEGIAARLGISLNTLKCHRQAMRDKTGVRRLRQLACLVRCGEPLLSKGAHL